MKQVMPDRERDILSYLIHLPSKMVQVHGHPHSADLVLYELCQKNCFNLPRAAYLVDNPDFDCVQGIAGYAEHELGNHTYDVWSDPDKFGSMVKDSAFRNQVRCICKKSSIHKEESLKQVLQEVTQDLGLHDVGFLIWPMKHDNHGILVYETHDHAEEKALRDHMHHGAHLLSFCPVG